MIRFNVLFNCLSYACELSNKHTKITSIFLYINSMIIIDNVRSEKKKDAREISSGYCDKDGLTDTH